MVISHWAMKAFKKSQSVRVIPVGVRVYGKPHDQFLDFQAPVGSIRRKLPVEAGKLTMTIVWPMIMKENPQTASHFALQRKAAEEAQKSALEKARSELEKQQRKKEKEKQLKQDAKIKEAKDKERQKKKAK